MTVAMADFDTIRITAETGAVKHRAACAFEIGIRIGVGRELLVAPARIRRPCKPDHIFGGSQLRSAGRGRGQGLSRSALDVGSPAGIKRPTQSGEEINGKDKIGNDCQNDGLA
jgi:hypothetical protein